jgi:hypothetical protein
MFGTVLEKLSGWFGQSFLLARFFPCLVSICANGALAFLVVPAARPRLLAALKAAPTGDAVVYLVLGLGAVAAVAFTLSPFVHAAIRLLEADWMLAPGAGPVSRRLGQRMVRDESRRYEQLAAQEHALFRNRADLPKQEQVRTRLSEARKAGIPLRAVDRPELVEAAAREVDALDALRRIRAPIQASLLNQAIASLEEALQFNCADPQRLRLPIRERDTEPAQRLTALQRLMVEVLVVDAKDIAEGAEARVVDRREQVFGHGELAPTAYGNLAAALRSYAHTRYGIEFGYFWPRFLLAIQKNQPLTTAITTATVQVEFAVASAVLTALSVVLWLGLFVHFYQGPFPLFLIMALGPVLVGFWLNVVEVSQKEYADVARSAIDLGRFDLLAALRIPLPPTLRAERTLWDRLARLALLNELEAETAYNQGVPPK